MKRKPDGKMHRAGRALVQAGRVLTGKQMAGRNLTVFPDDVFLTSYRRSGNTWTRFLIGNLIYQDEPVTFANIESRLPEIYFNFRSLPAQPSAPTDSQESRVLPAAVSARDLYCARPA
jgi:hypothetical protein